MPLNLKAKLAKLYGSSRQDAVKLALQAELDHVEGPPPGLQPTRRSSTSCPGIMTIFADASALIFVGIAEPEFDLAADAYDRFGKGRHPTALNMGDCYAYACARSSSARLLYKGNDFTQTDLDLIRIG